MKAVGLIRQMVVWSCLEAFGWEEEREAVRWGLLVKKRSADTCCVKRQQSSLPDWGQPGHSRMCVMQQTQLMSGRFALYLF